MGATLVAVGAGLSVLPLWALPRPAATAVAGLMHVGALLIALVCMARAAVSGDEAMRVSRLLFAAALGAVAAGSLVVVGFVVAVGSVPVPSIADPLTLMWIPLAAWGFWRVPTPDGRVVRNRRLFADGAVAATALLFASWVAVIEPVAGSGRWTTWGATVQLAYPVSDVFIAAMVLSLLPRARADLRPFFNCVAVGLLLIALSDSGAALLLAERGVVAFGWPDVALQAGLCLLAYAALLRPRSVQTGRVTASFVDRALPVVPVVVAGVVAVWHVLVAGSLDVDAVLLGTAMLTAILVRQLVHARELVDTAEQHRFAAAHDELTGLANRKAFLELLGEHVTTPGAVGASVLVLDLDGFKEVNDTFGHECGDAVLVHFADALASLGSEHLTARLGGDEFAVLVRHEAAELVAEALAHRLVAVDLSCAPGVAVSCSVGVATLRPGDTPADVLRRADLAMYAAKRNPESRVVVFDDRLTEQADRRTLLLAQLPGATARGEMTLVFQPIYGLVGGELAGAEALLRWTHPLFGVVAPDEFVPLAEESGAIRGIGAWVLETALAQVAGWEQQGRWLPRLFVNCAAAEFTDALSAQVLGALRRHGLDPSRLTVEITESQLPGLAVHGSVQDLRASGVHVALDDFGTGWSSLGQLARLPVDILKIDRALIRNLDSPSGRPVLDAIVGLARALGLVTVAEGVEDLDQAAEVANVGVDLAQGFLFSRPLPAAELTGRLPAVPTPVGAPVPAPRSSAPGRTATGERGRSKA